MSATHIPIAEPPIDEEIELIDALVRIYGPTQAAEILAIADVYGTEADAMPQDDWTIRMDELKGPAPRSEFAAALVAHRLITRPCEPITTELPCDCEAHDGA